MSYNNNANWPNLRILFAPNANGTFDGQFIRYSDITYRLLHSWDVQRGRQYELDTMMAGTLTAMLNNDDAAFDPLNTTSPFAGGVLPERLVQLVASWPNSINMMTYDQATGGEQNYVTTTTVTVPASIAAASGAFTIVAAAVTGAFQGSQVWRTTIPSSSSSGSVTGFPCAIEAPSAWRPNQPYTFSLYQACVTSGQSPQLTPGIQWYKEDGTLLSTTTGTPVTLTGNTTPTYSRLTVSVSSVPAGAVSAEFITSLTSTVSATTTIYSDAIQQENNASVSAFTAPGKTYPIYTGNVERYPTNYDLSGTRITTPLVSADPLSLLSATIQQASFSSVVQFPLGPDTVGANFIYSFGDGGGASQFQDTTGSRIPATINNSSTVPSGTTFIRTGQPPNDQTVATGWSGPPATVPLGPQQGPVLNTFLGANQATYSYTVTEWIPPVIGSNVESELTTIRIPPNSTTGIGGPPATAFMRMICFRVNPGAISSDAILWEAFGGPGITSQIQAYVFSNGNIAFGVTSGGTTQVSFQASAVQDGNWHMVFFGIDPVANLFWWGLDNGAIVSQSISSWAPGHFHIDDLGGTYFGDGTNNGAFAFKGQLMFAVEWPYVLNTTQANNVYNSWLTDYQGDTADQRIARILQWAQYTGTTKLDTGYATSLGPATDIDGNDAVTNLQNVVQTENGEHFYDVTGTYTWHNRAKRYAAGAPTYIFGENIAGGEIPYESCELDYDITNIDNNVQTTQVSTNVISYSQTSSITAASNSQKAFGLRSLNITNQSTNLQDCQDEANYLASVNAYPRSRVATLTIHPASNPSILWPVCLALELETYVQINRRPKGSAFTNTLYGFIENIHWTANNTNDAVLVLQISPAPGQNLGPAVAAYRPWNLAPMYGTMQAASSGQPTITVNIPSGNINNTQTLAQQVCVGLQLFVGYGTAHAELLTVQSVGTSTITFTTNLVNNHSLNEGFREASSVVTSANVTQFDAWSTLGDGTNAFNNIQINY